MATTWRLLINTVATGANPALAEFVLAATPGGSSLFTGGTAAAQTIYSSSYPASLAFDANPATIWSGIGNVPQWLQYSPTAAISPVEMRLTVRGDGSTNGNPLTFDLQNDNTTPGTFVTVQSYTAAAWVSGQTQTFVVSAPVAAAAPPSTGNAMVSQSRLEVLSKGLPKVTVAQSQLEVLGKTNPTALVLQSFVEVLFRPSSNTPGPRPRRVFVAMT